MDKGLEKNITIADVAEALGVSKTTVSRAISGKAVSYTHLTLPTILRV